MQDTKITKDRIRNHFTYGWWKYALLALVAVFGWNLIYTTSAYRAPRDKRLDIYFVTYSVPTENLDWFKAQPLLLYPPPELEDSNAVSVVYTADDNYYGMMQLTTFMGAGEGDIYVLPKERFDAFKSSGVFVALDDAIASGALSLGDIDVTSAIAVDEEGNRGVFGVPMDSLYGFIDQKIDNRGMYLCVMAYSANQEKAIGYVDWLVETMAAPKPEWMIEQEAKQPQPSAQPTSEMPSY